MRDYIYEQMKAILSSANIEYVKWDMNRQLSEVGNEVFPPERQREIWHRYVLGVYEMQERLLTDFPDLLLETARAAAHALTQVCCTTLPRYGQAMIQTL